MTFSYFLSLLHLHKKTLAIAILLMLIESTVSLTIPWLVGQFSASFINGQTLFDLTYFQIILLWLSLFLLQAGFRFLSTYKVNYIGAQLLTKLSCRLFDHIQRLPMQYFNHTKKGETLALLSNDVNIISYFLSGILTGLVPLTFVLVGAIVLMFSINVPITLCIIFLIPAFYLLLKIIGKEIKPLSEKLIEKQAQVVAIASENINSIKLVKAFTREKVESETFARNAQEIQLLRKKQLKIQSFLSPLIQLLVSSGILIIIVLSTTYYQSGELTLAEIVSLLMYGLLFAKPISGFANLYGQVQQARGASKRLTDIFNLEIEPQQLLSTKTVLKNVNKQHTVSEPSAYEQAIAKQSVAKQSTLEQTSDKQLSAQYLQLQALSFSYQENSPLLTEINLEIKQGENIVLFGPNGSGKTTLFDLLMRFMQPTAGKILLNGNNINHIELTTLRAQIGLVSQEIDLCSGTIFDNITFGATNATLAEVEQAAEKAFALAFIQQLPQGFQTKVGENGVLLSGGQRQRIALARALLKAPKLLLLDEPTSMIDLEGNELFKHTLIDLLKTSTTIIVTHDPQMLSLADRVFIIEQGKLKRYDLKRTSSEINSSATAK